ncbi:MAG: hypothetical protein ABL921_00370 [Pirellula sp.]
MRLTLRTLLAYRDGVLDPQDATALELRIKDSSTAQKISQRIEEGMRNRKLAPIPVDAREFGFDANLVAEYLDDTIPVEVLPEMERRSLENNALLSEIGSCHQIISRALSVPVSVPTSLRQRIRELPANPTSKLARSLDKHGKVRRVDRPNGHPDEPSSPSNGSLAASGSLRKRNTELRTTGIELSDVLGKQVPEYLIGSDRGWWKRFALAGCLLIALVTVGAIAIGPLDQVQQLLNTTQSTEIATDKGATRQQGLQPSNGANATKNKGASASGGVPESENTIDTASESNRPSDSFPHSTIQESSSAPPVPMPEPLTPSSDVAKAEPSTKSAPGIPLRVQWLPEDKPSAESIVMSEIRDTSTGAVRWRRLSSGEYVSAGQRILVPPAQRTELRVEPGVRWLCAGENDIDVLASDSSAKIGLKAGRAILFATPDANSIDVDCNGLLIAIRFRTADASCGLEVIQKLHPANDSEIDSGKLSVGTMVRLLGVQGEIDFSARGPKEQNDSGSLNVGQYQVWNHGIASEKQELSEAPWWLRTSYEQHTDRFAAADLHKALSVRDSASDDASVDTELLRLTKSRRSETAALAARTRIMQGHFDGTFTPDGFLNRRELHIHWNAILNQMVQSLGREQNLTSFVASMKAETQSRFPTVMSLLVPKSQQQLIEGADKLIVESLSSSSMDERATAIYQLENITGKTLGYHPDKNSVESIQLWRKLLGKSEIRFPESSNP